MVYQRLALPRECTHVFWIVLDLTQCIESIVDMCTGLHEFVGGISEAIAPIMVGIVHWIVKCFH